MILQQQRNTRGDRVAGFEHVLDEFLRLTFFEAARHGIDNGRTALVNAEGIDILGREA
ncbi:hypothetical protein D3C73_1325610 [compost metagenome]